MHSHVMWGQWGQWGQWDSEIHASFYIYIYIYIYNDDTLHHYKARQGKFIYIAHFIHSGNSKCFT